MPADRLQLFQYKGNRCAVCGMSVQEMMDRYHTFERIFEFHHVDQTTKAKDYDNLIRRELSTEQIIELDKCVLLCRVCHGIVHAQGRPTTAIMTMKYGKHSAQQKFNGQLVFDYVEHKATFLTNEPVYLHPYNVQFGSKKPKVIFGTDLRDEQLNMMMNDIAKHKSVSVRTIEGELVLRLTHTGEDTLRFECDLSFQPAKFEVSINPMGPYLWVRNGMALTKDGNVIRHGTLKTNMRITSIKH